MIKKESHFRIILCLMLILLCVLSLSACDKGEEGDEGKIDYSDSLVVIYTGNIRGNVSLLPRIAAVKADYMAKGADVLLVDAGNYLQGSICSTYDSGKSVAQLMDYVGYDVLGVGEGEFAFLDATYGAGPHSNVENDDTFDKIAASLQHATVLSANTFVNDGETQTAVFAANKVFESHGNKIAIVGITDDRIENVYYSKDKPISVLNAAECKKPVADSDLTLYLTNANLSGELTVTAGGGFYCGVTVVKNNVVTSNGNYELPEAESADVRAKVNTLYSEALKLYPTSMSAKCDIDIPCDAAAARSGESAIGDLITDALLWAAKENKIGEQTISVADDHVVSLWNGGNIRFGLQSGSVTLRELKRIVSYPNTVCVMYLTGRQLLETLEASAQGLPYGEDSYHANAAFFNSAGMNYSVDTKKAFDGTGEKYGAYWEKVENVSRVNNVKINGADLSPSDIYAVVCSNAVFNGQDSNYVSADRGGNSFPTNYSVIETVLRYINEELEGVVDSRYAKPSGRITIE